MAGQDKANSSPFDQADSYVRFLLHRRNRVFYLKPWNGNSGDMLIWLGTERLIDDLRIPRTLDPRTADVILVPGGNQTMWQANIDVWKETWTRWPDKEFVVGPTTVQLGFTTWRQDLETTTANVTGIFARDPASYQTLLRCGLNGRIETGLSHDPALHLWDSDLIGAHRQAATEEFVLAAFRFDHEGAINRMARASSWDRLLPPVVTRRIRGRGARDHHQERIDMVARYTRRTEPLRICDASQEIFECFLENIRSASEVHTDRLHCMLLAAMLDKPTFAYPTAYGKLEAVYEHSVKGKAKVEFIEGTRLSSIGDVTWSCASPRQVVQP
ncbi:MAG TPA: polysaccharide pyruvyl transferase family protein [Sedimentisphaerales bacterium]|nr:polysaccharide pyruvyl transferase family protein [Sedimentisphaerales bacterium]